VVCGKVVVAFKRAVSNAALDSEGLSVALWAWVDQLDNISISSTAHHHHRRAVVKKIVLAFTSSKMGAIRS
jgi:hypothetical protein